MTEQELRYALTRLQVCVADADGLANYPPALLRDDVRLMLAEARVARQHDADQRATIAALEGEVGMLRGGWEEMRNRCQVLYAWHAVGKMTDYGLHAAGCCPICDVVRAARATPAGEGK